MAHETHTTDGFGGPARDANDHRRLRHGRDRHVGFAVGDYRQPPPMLFTRDGHNVFLGDTFRGRPAFLVCGGPSLEDHDLSPLDERGFLTLAVNNAATVVRPRLWCAVDDPGNFCDVVWRDPGIWKFVPLDHMEKTFTVRDANDELVPSTERVGDMPAVFGFRRNEAFQPDQWLHEDSFNWGNHSKRVDELGHEGSRSVMYVALRLLYHLGVRTVYLLGCDFRMRDGARNYAFDQDRSPASVRNNNASYEILDARLERLRPLFEEAGFHVRNCTPNSGLTAFPHVPYEEAVDSVRTTMPGRIVTAGMYDRSARERQVRREGTPSSGGAPPPSTTIVVPAPADRLSALSGTLATWRRHHPELLRSPPIVVTDAAGAPPADLDVRVERTDRRGPEAIEHRLCSVLGDCDTERAVVLDPRAVAKSPARLPRETFTSPLSGAAWSYAKPVDTVALLDAWGDAVPGLREHARLDVPFEATSDRVRVPLVADWWWSVRIAWFREVLELLEGAPGTGLVTRLWYVARRRGESVERLDLKGRGWLHSYGWSSRAAVRRARRALDENTN